MKASLLIVEDCEATRERMENAIIEGGEYRLVGSVGSFKAAQALLESAAPDILLTDLDLPDGNGINLIKMLSLPHITTQLAIVITVFGDEEHVIKALRAGASGYLLKDDDFIEINSAIGQMRDGGAPISPGVARFLLQELSPAPKRQEDRPVGLSERENEILLLVSKGYTSKEIGNMLNVSFHTVNAHVKNIYKKLAVTNRTGAIYEATKKGII
ncbi:MAG: response regulator transcription factor [Cellvibrionaceae bacterium]|nr:response regulator transcription factor [Cellvibrionaceae bacterium]MCV6624642.1 response regulator transcription factor [Cellvibrionaceae bacterium]